MIKLIISCIAVLALALMPGFALAQKNNDSQSYYFKRGVELYNLQNYAEAEKMFSNELSSNPANAEAHYYLALVHVLKKKYGDALTETNNAIKFFSKKRGDEKKSGLLQSYILRANIYGVMDKDSERLADIEKAISIAPHNSEGLLEKSYYYASKKLYDLALDCAEKAIKISPLKAEGYAKKANALYHLNRFAEAEKELNYANSLDPNNALTLLNRSSCRLKLAKYNDALDDAFAYIENNNSYAKGISLIKAVADSSFTLVNIKLLARQKAQPNNPLWFHVMASVLSDMNRFSESNENFLKAIEVGGENPTLLRRLASNYYKLGDFNTALSYANKAVDLDSTQYYSFSVRSYIARELGDKKLELADLNKCVELAPNNSDSYYQRASFEQLNDKALDAVADLTAAIDLEPDNGQYYLTRGSVYNRLGEKSMALQDYKKVLEIYEKNSLSDEGDKISAMYAHFYLGNHKQAEEMMTDILNKTTNRSGDEYDAACLYSLMNDAPKALTHLRSSLENGYKGFAHLRSDFDLDNIKALPEFEQLLSEFEPKLSSDASANGSDTQKGELKVAEIPFSKEAGNLAKVKCEINGLPLHFIFDTGASDVSISTVEATFMLKNGYLNESDISGKQYYLNANGEISEGTIIVLRNIKFGDMSLRNIRASVVKSQRAPLLLGQTVMQRLGRIEIDNDAKLLRIHYRE
ncbi:MAG: tetratricopeptide repeat protein [Bacteroidales bacterium]|nr:tetratricopeptide repeat protein [Bacteroidales bacterium]